MDHNQTMKWSDIIPGDCYFNCNNRYPCSFLAITNAIYKPPYIEWMALRCGSLNGPEIIKESLVFENQISERWIVFRNKKQIYP